MTGSVYTLGSEERAWLQALHKRLWPAQGTQPVLSPMELTSVLSVVQDRSLLTNMFCSGMFGGYGMHILEHELFPGVGPVHLLSLDEKHLPGPCVKRPGEGRDDAWEVFSRFTHSERNVQWLKGYRMDLPRPRTSYDY